MRGFQCNARVRAVACAWIAWERLDFSLRDTHDAKIGQLQGLCRRPDGAQFRRDVRQA